MKLLTLVCLALIVPALTKRQDDEPEVPGPPTDAGPKELLKYWGYPVDEFEVVTADNYILQLYRIPRGRNDESSKNVKRPVVLLQHGMGTSSVDWLINNPDQSAGYMFADAGFDVWLGNFRGSKYGRRHRIVGPDAQLFWQFSWNDMADKDLTAIINFILSQTNAPSIYYVAHSLGATAGLALFSTNQNLAKRVKQFHALAPIHTLDNVQGVLKYTKSFLKDENLVSNLFSSAEFPGEYTPNYQLQSSWAKYVCKDPENDLHCQNVLLMISGPGTQQIDPKRIDAINENSPTGVSIQTITHLGQMLDHKTFRAYDYGSPQVNKDHYGDAFPQPPLYNINTNTVQTFIYSSEYDWIAEPLDIESTAARMPNTLASKLVVPTFNHMEFIWGTRAAKEVYNPVIAQIAADFVV